MPFVVMKCSFLVGAIRLLLLWYYGQPSLAAPCVHFLEDLVMGVIWYLTDMYTY